MNKPKLTKVVDIEEKKKKADNYKQCIDRHLGDLSQDQKESSPLVLFVGALYNDGVIYHCLTESNGLELLGSLEVLKASIQRDLFLGE